MREKNTKKRKKNPKKPAICLHLYHKYKYLYMYAHLWFPSSVKRLGMEQNIEGKKRCSVSEQEIISLICNLFQRLMF